MIPMIAFGASDLSEGFQWTECSGRQARPNIDIAHGKVAIAQGARNDGGEDLVDMGHGFLFERRDLLQIP
jgi:hypothetical protein